MALSATFTANFASFYDAVDKADAKLKDFGSGADKVGGRLTALGNSFSGVKIIQDATLMVKAVEDIGGASKLTEKELARLGATTNEAVAKMKALGMEVPQNLQQIADKTKAATKATTDWAGSVTTLAGTFTKIAGAVGLGFSLKGVIDFGKAIIEDAGHIADLSAKLGISAEAVQRFGYAAEQTGASMDTVGTAIGKMNVMLAQGDQSTIAALDKIGLSFKDIRAMKPEDAFAAIAQAIQKIPDPMLQAQVATALFGKTGMELLPAINQGLIDIGNSAKVMSDKSVAEMDRIGDKWNEMVKNFKASTAEFMVWALDQSKWTNYGIIVARGAGSVLDAYDALTGSTGAVARASLSLEAALKKVPDPLAGIGLAAHDTAGLLDHYNLIQTQSEQQAAKFAAAQQKAATAAETHKQKIEDLAATLSGVGLTQKVTDLDEATQLAVQTWGEGVLNSKELVAQVQALGKEGAALTPILTNVYLAHLNWSASIGQVKVGIKDLLADMPNYTQQMKNMMAVELFDPTKMAVSRKVGAGDLLKGLPDLAPAFKSYTEKTLKTPFMATMGKDLVTQIPQTMLRAFEGGGNAGKAVGGQIGSTVASSAAKSVGPLMTKAIGGGLGKAIGGLAGNALPIVGPIIGAAVGGLIDKAFSHKGRDAAVAFADSMGGFDELHQKLGTLGAEGEKMWGQLTGVGKKDEQGAQKIIGDIQQAFEDAEKKAAELQARLEQVKGKMGELGQSLESFGGVVPKSMRPLIDNLLKSTDLTDDMKKGLASFAQDPSWQTLEKTATDLGINLEGLGKNFQQAKLGDIAFGYTHDLQMFADAGADMQVVLEGMSDELSDLYSHAQETGTKLPNTLKPYYETLVAQGRLLDENGEKVDHLNEDTFADIEDKGLKDVVTVLEAIRDLLKDSLPKAAEQGAKDIQANFDRAHLKLPVDVDYNTPPLPPGSPGTPGGGPIPQPGPGMESYQGGTDGFKNFGAGTPVMLHGWEAVVPREESGAFATVAASGGAPAAAAMSVVINAQGAFFDTPDSLQRLANKVSDALTAKYSVMGRLRAAV